MHFRDSTFTDNYNTVNQVTSFGLFQAILRRYLLKNYQQNLDCNKAWDIILVKPGDESPEIRNLNGENLQRNPSEETYLTD